MLHQSKRASAGDRATASRRFRPQAECLEGRALLSAGDLDLLFGGTGVVTTTSNSSTSNIGGATDVAVQADGKIVEVGPRTYVSKGATRGGGVVLRYNPDGSLDTTFGTGGRVNLDLNAPTLGASTAQPHPWSLAIQADGKLVITGGVIATYGKGKQAFDRAEIYVARLNMNGSLDTTFNGTGSTRFGLSQGNIKAIGTVIQADGRIVVGGGDEGGGRSFVVARFTTNGQLDTTFGPNGQGYNLRSTGWASSITLDASGRILLGGRSDEFDTDGERFGAVVRYTANGLVDATFGRFTTSTTDDPLARDGQAVLSEIALGGLTGIGVQSNGQIVATSTMNPVADGKAGWLGVVRLNSLDGSVDTTFGASGYAFDPTVNVPSDLVVQPDDQILITCRDRAEPPPGEDRKVFVTARVLADGAGLDSTFGNAGRVFTALGSNTRFAFASSIALAPGDTIVVAGHLRLQSNGEARFATARYLNDVGASLAGAASASTLSLVPGGEPALSASSGIQGNAIAILIPEPIEDTLPTKPRPRGPRGLVDVALLNLDVPTLF